MEPNVVSSAKRNGIRQCTSRDKLLQVGFTLQDFRGKQQIQNVGGASTTTLHALEAVEHATEGDLGEQILDAILLMIGAKPHALPQQRIGVFLAQ